MNATATATATSPRNWKRTVVGAVIVALFAVVGVGVGMLLSDREAANAATPTPTQCTLLCGGGSGSAGNLPAPVTGGTGGVGNR